MSVELNLTAKEIYEKEFRKSKLITRLKELEIENQNLKIKIEALKNTSREDKPVQVTNLDILKRLSKLETAVFGTNNIDHDLY